MPCWTTLAGYLAEVSLKQWPLLCNIVCQCWLESGMKAELGLRGVAGVSGWSLNA